MVIVPTILLIIGMTVSLVFPPAIDAAGNYEESLKQLAEGVIAEAIKAKKQRLGIVDLTDTKGQATPIGRFLSEELGTQILVTGELQVVERTLVQSTLKKFQVPHVDPAHAKAVRRAAKAMRAEVLLTGSYLDSGDGLLITVKLVSPLNAQVVGAVRGQLPKAGPLGELLKEAAKPPPVKLEGPKEPPIPAGLGFHRNDYYELVVHSIERAGVRVKVGLTVENRSLRDLKVLCFLQNTLLKDEQGTAWTQGVEDNREGLCTRGIELSPREKEQTVLTFTAPSESTASHFTLHYHEKSPRRDTEFAIDGLTLDVPAAVTSTPSP
jgi:TolB-like protein